LLAAFEPARARAEQSRRRRKCLLVLGADQVERGQLGGRREEREEPVELLWKRGERRHRADRAGRAVLVPREPPAEAVDRLARPGRELGRLVAAGFQELGHRGQRRGGGPSELGPAARWPKEHDRADSEGGRESPAL